MCDYSLQGLPNRLAESGEQLVTHRFPTGSIGMASPAEIANPPCKPKIAGGTWWTKFKQWLTEPAMPPGPPAVCIAPGTCLRMTSVPESLRRDFGLSAVEKVKFVQFHAEPFQYRDGIEFGSGRRILLQALREGVAFEVIGLEEETEPTPRLRVVWPADDVESEARLTRVG